MVGNSCCTELLKELQQSRGSGWEIILSRDTCWTVQADMNKLFNISSDNSSSSHYLQLPDMYGIRTVDISLKKSDIRGSLNLETEADLLLDICMNQSRFFI